MTYRKVPFSREIYIEREDFREEADKKYFRLKIGGEVRLKNAYIVRCTGCKKDADGNILEVYAEYDPETRSGLPGSNRKVKGTIHWLSIAHSMDAEVRLYDHLFLDEDTSSVEGKELAELLNPESLKVLPHAKVETFLHDAAVGAHYQFQRIGYFVVDKDTAKEGRLILNRTTSLKDTWGKIATKK